MHDSAPNPELLNSLGRMVRGLSALFWGLPIALVVCVQTAKGEWLHPMGIVPSVAVTALLCYGLNLLGHFQKQERIWHQALDRAKIFAVVNLGLSPFLYWWNRMPSHPFYSAMVEVMSLTALLFLFALNPMLLRLTAMLPDETLRIETRLFTTLNRYLLLGSILLFGAYLLRARLRELPPLMIQILAIFDRSGLWVTLILTLLPLAMTMAMIWKIKEVILTSIFGPGTAT